MRDCLRAGEPSDDAADECDRVFEGAFGAGEVADQQDLDQGYGSVYLPFALKADVEPSYT